MNRKERTRGTPAAGCTTPIVTPWPRRAQWVENNLGSDRFSLSGVMEMVNTHPNGAPLVYVKYLLTVFKIPPRSPSRAAGQAYVVCLRTRKANPEAFGDARARKRIFAAAMSCSHEFYRHSPMTVNQCAIEYGLQPDCAYLNVSLCSLCVAVRARTTARRCSGRREARATETRHLVKLREQFKPIVGRERGRGAIHTYTSYTAYTFIVHNTFCITPITTCDLRRP